MESLVSTFSNQGRWTEAEELEVQVLELRKSTLEPEHPDTLISMGNLRVVFAKRSKEWIPNLAAARTLFLRSFSGGDLHVSLPIPQRTHCFRCAWMNFANDSLHAFDDSFYR